MAQDSRPRGSRPQPLNGAAIRLLTVPDSAPPLDYLYGNDPHGNDAAHGVTPGRTAAAADGGAAAADGGAAAPEGGAAARERGTAADGQGSRRGGEPPVRSRSDTGRPATTGPGEAFPGRFAQVLAETLAGSRSRNQLTPWTSVQARRRIRQLGPMLTGGSGELSPRAGIAGAAPRVRRVLTAQPATDVVEMAVIVDFGLRVRAIAVRLERVRERYADAGRGESATVHWICTAVEAA